MTSDRNHLGDSSLVRGLNRFDIGRRLRRMMFSAAISEDHAAAQIERTADDVRGMQAGRIIASDWELWQLSDMCGCTLHDLGFVARPQPSGDSGWLKAAGG